MAQPLDYSGDKRNSTKEFLFILLSPYPTKKAYGVTTRHTMEAVSSFGYNVKIIAPNMENNFNRNSLLYSSHCSFNQFTQQFLENRIIAPLHFYLKSILFLFNLRKVREVQQADVIWSRHPLVPLLLRHMKALNVCEIHQLVNPIILKSLRIFVKPQKLIIGSISYFLHCELNKIFKSRFSIVDLPMAVPAHFYDKSLPKKEPTKFPFLVGYVGSFKSADRDQGVLNAVEQLERISAQNSNWRFLFAGIGIDGSEKIRSFLEHKYGRESINKYQLIPYVEHDNIPQLLQQCFTLLIPHPEGTFFKSKFPLKAMEYAASSRPILCTDTEGHRNIFSQNEVFFYQLENANSINETLQYMFRDSGVVLQRVERAFNKSLKYTYQNRVNSAINLTSKIEFG